MAAGRWNARNKLSSMVRLEQGRPSWQSFCRSISLVELMVFVEIIQFHPSYAYEDFIQGIRPRSRADGTLEYVMFPEGSWSSAAKPGRERAYAFLS